MNIRVHGVRIRRGLLPALGVAAAVAAAAGTGCAGGRAHKGPSTPAAAVQEVPAGRFDAGRALLEGIDTAGPGEMWRPGDRVLLGIAADGAGPPREWYLRVTAVGSPITLDSGEVIQVMDSLRFRPTAAPGTPWLFAEYPLVMMRVELFDGSGAALSSSTAMMPAICLRYGLTEFIEQERAGQSLVMPGEVQEKTAGGDLKATERQLRNIAGWLALMKLPVFLNRDKSMDGLLWELIERPGLMSIVFNGGVSMSLAMKAADAVPEEAAGLPGPAFRVPLRVEINGTKAMECRLLIAPATPPLGPCNGLVAIDAVNPRDPGKRVTIRLLAARRGGGSGAGAQTAKHAVR